VVSEAVRELDAEFYASWHHVRSDPDLVRAKAQALKELEVRLLAKFAQLGIDA